MYFYRIFPMAKRVDVGGSDIIAVSVVMVIGHLNFTVYGVERTSAPRPKVIWGVFGEWGGGGS